MFMKNEPWIDKIYKDKLSTRELSLDMSHWAQAEAMIISQEKEKRKRRVIFWLLFLGIGVYLGIITWNKYQQSQESKINIPVPVIPILEKPQIRNEVAIINKAPIANSDQIKMTTNKINANNNSSLITKNVINSLKQRRTLFNNSVQDKNESKNTKHVQSDLKSISNELNNLTIKVSNEFRSQKTMELATINMPIGLIGINKPLIMPRSELERAPIQVKKMNWKERGIRMTLAQASGLNLSDPSISHAGLEYYHQHSITTHLFYGYSIGYKSNFNHTQYAQVITSYQFVGFGANVKNVGVKPEWMNALYAQGNVGIELKKNRLIIGMKPEFLIGTRGQVDELQFKEPTGIKDIAQAEISSLNSGWLKSGSLNNLAWTVSLGYEYKVIPKLAIGVQIEHSLKSPYRPLDLGIKQQTAAQWNTGFRFSYILN